MTATNEMLARHVEEVAPNVKCSTGRKADYIIGNLIEKGLEDFHEMEFSNKNYSQEDTSDNILGGRDVEAVDLMAI